MSILGHFLPRVIGRVTGRVIGRVTGRVIGRVIGRVTGRVIGRVTGRLARPLLGLAVVFSGSLAHADDAAQAPPQDLARPGDLIDYEPRPALAHPLRACSFRHPLCVLDDAPRRPATRPEDELLALLDAADRAWDVATGALALPAPETDFAETGALDLYLVDGDPYATRTLLGLRDPRGGFDRASAFAMVGRGVTPGCALDAAAARVVARAILFGVSPATDSGSALAESVAMARLMVPCWEGPAAAIREFQAHPDLGLAETLAGPNESLASHPSRLVTTEGELYAAGASLFYDWLDERYGGYPGAIVRTIWSLSPTRTALAAGRWNDEPDGFEVLRTSFKGALTTGSTVDDLWLDFAVARAFLPEHPVRVDWSVDWPAKPRTLLSGAAVAPTGAGYVSVDCRDRPKGARLRFEARWEERARLLWTLVRIDRDGHELSRVGVPSADRGTEAQMTLIDLDGVARVLIVGSSAGDPLYPFDPDDHVWEPHGWIVSLASE